MQMYRMTSDVSRSTSPVYSSTIRTHVTMKQSVDITTFIYLLILFYNMNDGYCSTAELTCPDLAYIEKSALINCLTSEPFTSLQYLGPGDFLGPQCSSTLCIDAEGYNASVTNTTSSSLGILNVQPRHAGQWKCNILQHGPSASCTLVITKTPICSITSKEDTNVLAQDQELTLTVGIQDYYCSTALNFSLQTGNVTTLLTKADSVASVTHNTSSVTLNVTDSHLGVVRLVFSCHHKQTSLTCDGVSELMTQTCSISSDKDTDRLGLNEELTLSVDIIVYNCPVASIFTLQTGNVQHLLNVSSAGTGIDRATQTFHVTKTHLGGVRVMFNCQQKHWNLTCAGITKLKNVGLATASTIIIAACVVGAIVFLIIVVIIILFLVKRKQQVTGSPDTHTYDNVDVTVEGKRREADKYPSSEDTEHQAEDNAVVGLGGSAGNYQQGSELRINPVYIPTTVGDRLSTTGTSTETGGDHLHPESRGEYVALDRNLDQPSNSYEHLRLYEQIANI
ncbi:uncharacterized protein LOC125375940 [Haliotis rufescens]|uniref:uncharacterized protein LOC125375940 n=1 Tax=Haliotis rufescens TaxID=6454 RepID=UPI00201ECD1F|nr:uncharacterized protein LOC125375940 [Haliotis rufescens]